MATYATQTSVSVAKSRDEIEKTLIRYGATAFAYGWTGSGAMIQFEAQDRRIRMALPLPDRNSREFTQTPTGRARSAESAEVAWEQASRQRWRALLLVVKAKLEAIEAGISTFDTEFLSYIVLPDGSTVGDRVGPQIETAYQSGLMPAMLPELGRPSE